MTNEQYINLSSPYHPVEVYKNNHKGCWSVRDSKSGLVICYTDSVCLRDTKLVVRESSRQKVLANKRKNVHAFIKGYIDIHRYRPIALGTERESYKLYHDFWRCTKRTEVTYNPYKYDSFVKLCKDCESVSPIHEAKYVYLSSTGKVYMGENTVNNFKDTLGVK